MTGMPISPFQDWQQVAIWAVLAAFAILLLQRLPYVGRIVRFAVSLSLLALCIFLLIQQSPYEPTLARIANRIGLDSQKVVGNEVRIRMAPDGHFWARAKVNGVERRMLIDSGATVTAISEATARAASVDRDPDIMPIVLRTANGLAQASPATVDTLQVGGITGRQLKVVTSPALGELDVLGMNFLSKLASWRVEGRTLVLVPREAGRGTPER